MGSVRQMDETIVGRFVLSIAGRDSGRIHIVVAAEENFFHMVDGKTRKITAPKKKKIKHVKLLDVRDLETETMVASGGLTNKLAAAAVKKIISGEHFCAKR